MDLLSEDGQGDLLAAVQLVQLLDDVELPLSQHGHVEVEGLVDLGDSLVVLTGQSTTEKC